MNTVIQLVDRSSDDIANDITPLYYMNIIIQLSQDRSLKHWGVVYMYIH